MKLGGIALKVDSVNVIDFGELTKWSGHRVDGAWVSMPFANS